MIVVGFGHKARHGKNTAADYAATMWYGNSQYSFAEALYQECRDLYGMTTKDPQLLQNHGMKRRSENENYWIDKVFDKIDLNADRFSFISDVRFPNEAEKIKSVGGFVVDVRRLNQDGTPYVSPDRPADHPSETALDGYNFDFIITAKTGQSDLVARQANQIINYLYYQGE